MSSRISNHIVQNISPVTYFHVFLCPIREISGEQWEISLDIARENQLNKREQSQSSGWNLSRVESLPYEIRFLFCCLDSATETPNLWNSKKMLTLSGEQRFP